MIEEGIYESGNVKCIVRRTKSYDGYEMILLMYSHNGTSFITFDDGSILVQKMEEGIALTDEQIFCAWSSNEEIDGMITNIFSAMAIALGIGRGVKDAYDTGVLKGENNILKEVLNEYTMAMRNANPVMRPAVPWSAQPPVYEQMKFDVDTAGRPPRPQFTVSAPSGGFPAVTINSPSRTLHGAEDRADV